VVGAEKNDAVFIKLFCGAMARGSAAKTQQLMLMTMVNVGFGVQKTSSGQTLQRLLCKRICVDGDRSQK